MRVLYVADIYPHSTETYIETEIRGIAELGIEVHVWSENTNSDFPHPTIAPVHANESLSACIARARPDLVHVYFLNMAERSLAGIRRSGVPITVRAHGYEYETQLLNRLASSAAVDRVFVFPHMMADVDAANAAKVSALPTMFDPVFYPHPGEKDGKLVLRAASSLRSKNLERYFTAARLCPEHRFVLILGQGFDFNREALAYLQAHNAELGTPVEILVNLDWSAVSDWMRRAAIYMYTAPTHRPGMPISLAEAMASGCQVVTPDIDGMRGYVGGGGMLYRDIDEAAAMIRSTQNRSAEEWRDFGLRASAFAHERYSSRVVAPRLVEAWQCVLADATGPLRRLWRKVAARREARA